MALSEDGGRPSSMSEHDESPPEAEMENRALGGAYRDLNDGDVEQAASPLPRSYPGGGGYSNSVLESFRMEDPWSLRLHMAVLASLCFSFILLLMIICSRSWGVGSSVYPMSAGIFKVCGVVKLGESESSCPSWAEYCPNVVSFFRATSAFAILSLLLCVAMVFMDYYEMTRPGAFRWHHMAMTGGHHILWIFLGLTWTSFTGGWEQKCGTPDDYLEPGVRQYHSSEHMTYAWGWMFVIWLWLVHAAIAVVLSLKLLGRQLPCGL